MNLCITFFFLIFNSFVYSQIRFKHFTTENGLPHDFTFRLFQDDKGYIWIGSDDGLAKFNGKEFKVFDRSQGLKSNYAIMTNSYNKDTLLIANWKGGIHFMKNDSIILPDVKNDSLTKISDSYPIGKDIFSNSYAGLHYKYQRMQGLNFERYLFKIHRNHQNQIAIGKKNTETKAISCRSKKVKDALYFYKGEYDYKSNTYQDYKSGVYLYGIYRYKENDSIALVFPFLQEKMIYAFGSYASDLFYATSQDQLFIFNSDSIVHKKQYSFDNNTIHFFAKTSFCEIIVTRDKVTGNDHIFVYDEQTNITEDISKKTNSNILVSDILVDKDENIWITSKADGLYQISKRSHFFSSIISRKEHVMNIITSDNEMIYFHTLNKIYGYNLKNQELYSQLVNGEIMRFSSNKVTDNEISILVNNGQEYITSFFLGNKIKSTRIFTDRKEGISYNSHHLWYPIQDISTSNKISPKKNGKSVEINTAIVVNDQIWIGTSVGIFIYDKNQKCFTRYYKNKKLPEKWIKKMIYQKGKGIWIISDPGLFLIEEKGNVIFFDKEDGLQSTKINDMLIDHFGMLWLATQKGLSVLEDTIFYNLGIHDGLPFSFASSIKEDKNCQIWVSGNKGIVKLDNSKAPFQSDAPPNLIIDKKQNTFLIDAINFSEKQNQLQYRSKEDQPWRDILAKQLEYSDYAIGDYQFQFRIRSAASRWVYSRNFPLRIEQVWYETIAFTISMAVIGALSLLLLTYLQLRKVKKRNQLLRYSISQSVKLEKELDTVRENVAQDFHDELGNKLAGITMLSGIMMKDKELKESKSMHLIAQVQKDANELYYGIKDFVWSIDSKSDHLRELIFYLTDFGEDLFEPLGISYKVEKKQIPEDLKLPYYWSKQLLLLFKEAMTNSFKHSEASVVVLEFSILNNTLKIMFSDNGRGFCYTSIKRKNGILNMQNRALKIGGKFFIRSNNGTKVFFEGPLSPKTTPKG